MRTRTGLVPLLCGALIVGAASPPLLAIPGSNRLLSPADLDSLLKVLEQEDSRRQLAPLLRRHSLEDVGTVHLTEESPEWAQCLRDDGEAPEQVIRHDFLFTPHASKSVRWVRKSIIACLDAPGEFRFVSLPAKRLRRGRRNDAGLLTRFARPPVVQTAEMLILLNPLLHSPGVSERVSAMLAAGGLASIRLAKVAPGPNRAELPDGYYVELQVGYFEDESEEDVVRYEYWSAAVSRDTLEVSAIEPVE